MTARHAFRDATMPLTERETEVLRLIARGRTNIQIADELGITFLTARNHVSSILSKLGVESRIEAADWWRAHGSHQPTPRRRTYQWTRALTGLIGLRLAAGLLGIALAVAALVAVAVLVVAAWPSDEQAAVNDTKGGEAAPATSVSSIATATETVAAAATPPPGDPFDCDAFSDVCQFTRDVEQWLTTGNADAFIAHIQLQPVTCTPDMHGVNAPIELCEGAQPGEVRNDFSVSGRTHGTWTSEQSLREWISSGMQDEPAASDGYGSGEFRAVRVGCPVDQSFAACRDRFAIVTTQIGWEGARLLGLYSVERSQTSDEFQIVSQTSIGTVPFILEHVLESGVFPSNSSGVFQLFRYYDLPKAGE